MTLTGEQVMNTKCIPNEGAQGIKKKSLEHIPCHSQILLEYFHATWI
jgi:hypothetical protein